MLGYTFLLLFLFKIIAGMIKIITAISAIIKAGRVRNDKIIAQKFSITAVIGETTSNFKVLLLGEVAPCE